MEIVVEKLVDMANVEKKGESSMMVAILCVICVWKNMVKY